MSGKWPYVLCSRHLIPVFSVGHIPFVLLECQLAQHGVVECGLVSVWKGVEVGGAKSKSGWGECGLFSVVIDMLQVCLVC